MQCDECSFEQDESVKAQREERNETVKVKRKKNTMTRKYSVNY